MESENLFNGLLWASQVWSESRHLGCRCHHIHPPVWVPSISKVLSTHLHPSELVSETRRAAWWSEHRCQICVVHLCSSALACSENNQQEDLFDQILLGQVDFPSPYWDSITDSAKVGTANTHTHTHKD